MAAVPSVGRAAGVERPAGRSVDAASDLYERYSTQIFGYCLHQLGSREEAEDAVQTTFMNAFRGLQRGVVPELESAWLFKIAHNVCLSRRRSSWRRGRVEAPNDLEVLQEVVPARERIGDELIRLQDVLEEMPENQRRAILLREWQGLTYREIADELDVSQSAVETLIFRARRALAAGLEASPSGERDRGWRKRARHAGDAGAVVVALKALASGGGAKLAVGALVAAATTIAAPIGTHHAPTVRHGAPVKAPVHVQKATKSASVTRHFESVAPFQHHATPAPARPKPLRQPTAPVHSGSPPSTSAPTPAPAPSPAPETTSTTAPEPQTSAYHAATPAPAEESPGKSGDAPGKAHENQASTPPVGSDPAAQPSEHGKDSAPGQQGKPDKSNGHN